MTLLCIKGEFTSSKPVEWAKSSLTADSTYTNPTTFLENWGSGVGRMVDACKNANLPEPEVNQNAAFVWGTLKRATIPASP